jgi:hypothetical protein
LKSLGIGTTLLVTSVVTLYAGVTLLPKLYPLLHLKAPLMNQALDLNIAWCVKAQLPPALTPTNKLL